MDQSHLAASNSIQLLKEALTDPRRTAATSSHYLSTLMCLHRRLRSRQPVHRVDQWARVDSLLPILRSYRNSSKKYYVAVILVALRKWPQARAKWLPVFYELAENIERRQSAGERTKRERRNWVTPLELQQMISQLGSQVESMHSAKTAAKRRVLFNHLALRFMTDLPSLRTQNLDAKLVTPGTDDGKDNVLMQQGAACTLICRKFKTIHSHGEQRIELPSKLCKVIRHSLKLFPRKWLLSLLTDGNRGMSANLISQLFGKIWSNKRVTPSLLRKLTVTTFMKNKPSMQQRVALSQAMLHSVQVQKAFYTKRA